MTSASNPNPTAALLYFFITTTVYFVIKYNIDDKTMLMATISYILCIILGEFFINLSLTNEMCGEPHWGTAFSVTAAPWIIVFGTFLLLLNLFPSWKIPFANTIGYGFALLGGVKKVVTSIFQSPSSSAQPSGLNKAIQHIYRDQSLLINEIGEGEDKFEEFWKAMSGARKPNTPDTLKNNLKSLVKIKYTVSEYIWYMLTGILVTSISYNYLVNIGCSNSAKVMLARRDAYKQKQALKLAEEERIKKNTERRVVD